MLNLLKDIWAVIRNGITFIMHTISSLFMLIANIPKYVNLLTTVLAELPPIYMAIATVTITISIVFLILGRNNG